MLWAIAILIVVLLFLNFGLHTAVCLPFRTGIYLITLALENTNSEKYIRGMAGLGAIGFVVRDQLGKKGAFSDNPWWLDTRLIHAIMYGMYAITGKTEFMGADILFSIGATYQEIFSKH
jgi:hypothetical protein